LRVLLFEDMAHHLGGHPPEWVAQVTGELSEQGHEVHVLTSRGWAKGPVMPGAAGMRRMPRRYLFVSIVADWFGRHGLLPRIAYGGRQFALVSSVRTEARRLAVGGGVAVVSLSMPVNVLAAAVLAPMDANWAVYEHFGLGSHSRRAALSPQRMQAALAERRERARRRQGGHVRLVACTREGAESWVAAYPWLDVRVVLAATRDPVVPLPRYEARQALGIEGGGPVALVLGSVHPGKDLSTVFAAFAGHDSPAELVAAGLRTGRAFAQAKVDHPELIFPAVRVIDGYQSVEQMRLLYSASNFAIVSGRSPRMNDSGALSDAVAHGIPVCCPDTGIIARLVRHYQLGVLYRPEDPADLRAAAGLARNFALDPTQRRRFLEDHSPARTASSLLAAAADPVPVTSRAVDPIRPS
jgi:glycosyltransferase involved in cell wall biosynthesis